MSNKRAEGKKMLGAWIDEDLKEELRLMAAAKGKSMSELATEILEEQMALMGVRKHGKKK
jgi:plasmid stability protein